MRKWRIVLFVVLMGLLMCGFDHEDTRVYDKADLFTEEQEQRLEEKIDQVSQEEKMDLVVVTIADANGKEAYQYAEWFYYEAGYSFGYDGTDKGTLYLIDLDNREIYVYCSEKADDFISDGEIEDLLDVTYEYAASRDYYQSAVAFVEKIPDCAGKSPVPIIIGIVISFVIATVVTIVLIVSQKTSHKVSYHAYMNESTSRMYRREDRFIRTTVVVRDIDNDSSSGGGSGGGGHSRGSGGGRSL